MNRRTLRRTTLWLSLGLIVLGCASPVFVTPPPAPSPKPGAVETIVALTAAAAQTETALSLPTATNTPTSTPLPTSTATITPTPTATVVFLGSLGANAPEGGYVEDDDPENGNAEEEESGYVKPPVVRPWSCGVSSRYPSQGTVLEQGEPFQAIWVVRNTGSKTWPKQGVDIAYHSGADLRDGKPYIDIPQSVGPGGSLMIKISMVAPNRRGEYSTRWSLRVGQFDFCHLRIAFEVK